MSIKVGSKVKVQWDMIAGEDCVVKYVPCASGDSWVLDQLDIYGKPTGREIRASYFAKMTEIIDPPDGVF